MLCIARACTRGITSRNVVTLKNGFGVQTFQRGMTQSRSTISSVFRKSQALFAQTPGLPRKSGTLLARFASTSNGRKSQKIVGTWLSICSGTVFVAVVLGGVTRLTESGLSMVTWRLLGEKMPTSEAAWREEFERYKAYPEYKITNRGMSLEEFKRIWWMEYAHRMWGRLIGVTFALPAMYFWKKGWLTPAAKKRVLILGGLIGLQGLMGWYMVKSGLEDRFDGPSDVPRVSQYRLASHLGLAFLIYAGLLYNAFDHLLPAKKPSIDYFSVKTVPIGTIGALRRLKRLVYATKGFVFVTALSGALVAGLDAGMIYNTFPKMADRWIPQDILAYSPTLRNFTENPTTAQFDHRILAMTTLALITLVGLASRKLKLPGRGKAALRTLVCAAYFQGLLGIMTLIYHILTPLAAIHQSGSLVLLTSVTWLCHELKHVKKILK